jgi:hypothetical protein
LEVRFAEEATEIAVYQQALGYESTDSGVKLSYGPVLGKPGEHEKYRGLDDKTRATFKKMERSINELLKEQNKQIKADGTIDHQTVTGLRSIEEKIPFYGDTALVVAGNAVTIERTLSKLIWRKRLVKYGIPAGAILLMLTIWRSKR